MKVDPLLQPLVNTNFEYFIQNLGALSKEQKKQALLARKELELSRIKRSSMGEMVRSPAVFAGAKEDPITEEVKRRVKTIDDVLSGLGESQQYSGRLIMPPAWS